MPTSNEQEKKQEEREAKEDLRDFDDYKKNPYTELEVINKPIEYIKFFITGFCIVCLNLVLISFLIYTARSESSYSESTFTADFSIGIIAVIIGSLIIIIDDKIGKLLITKKMRALNRRRWNSFFGWVVVGGGILIFVAIMLFATILGLKTWIILTIFFVSTFAPLIGLFAMRKEDEKNKKEVISRLSSSSWHRHNIFRN